MSLLGVDLRVCVAVPHHSGEVIAEPLLPIQQILSQLIRETQSCGCCPCVVLVGASAPQACAILIRS